jgi:hypothetical protein
LANRRAPDLVGHTHTSRRKVDKAKRDAWANQNEANASNCDDKKIINMKKYGMFVLRLIFVTIALYQLMNYYEYSKVKRNSKTIGYTYIETKIDSRGRGGSRCKIKVRYYQQDYWVGITCKQASEIEESNKLPDLYYSKERNEVISQKYIDRSIKFSVFCLVFVVITFFLPKKKD